MAKKRSAARDRRSDKRSLDGRSLWQERLSSNASSAAALLLLLAGCQVQPGGPTAGRREDKARDAGAERADVARRAPTPGTPTDPRPGTLGPTRSSLDVEAGADGAGDGGPGDGGFALLGAPLVFAPTPRGFGLSVVLRSGDPTTLALQLRADDE